MIKVNLKNTKTAISRFGSSETNITGTESAGSQFSTIVDQLKQLDLSALDTTLILKMVIKLVLLSSLPFGLKVYEMIHIGMLESKLQKVEENINHKNAERDQIQIQINNYAYLKRKEEEFNRKKELLSSLASSRLIIPRFLDEVQTAILPSVWLHRIEVSAEDKNEKKRNVSFTGEGVNEELINSFVEDLKMFVDANSLRLNTRDIKEGGSSIKVQFDIQAELRN